MAASRVRGFVPGIGCRPGRGSVPMSRSIRSTSCMAPEAQDCRNTTTGGSPIGWLVYRRTITFGTIAHRSICHKRQSCQGFSPRISTSYRGNAPKSVYPTGICPSLPGRPSWLAVSKRKKAECAKSPPLLRVSASTSRKENSVLQRVGNTNRWYVGLCCTGCKEQESFGYICGLGPLW